MLRNACEEKEGSERGEPAESQRAYSDGMRYFLLSHSGGCQQEGSPQNNDEVKHDAKYCKFLRRLLQDDGVLKGARKGLGWAQHDHATGFAKGFHDNKAVFPDGKSKIQARTGLDCR